MIDLANTLTRKKSRRREINAIPQEQELMEIKEERLFIPRIYAISTRKSRLPYIRILLSNKPVTALIDSGSAISCIPISTLQSLNKSLPASPSPSTALAANGTSITLLARVELPVNINGHGISHNMHVLKDEECPAPALLGSDFLQRLNELGLKVTLDLYKQQLIVGDQTHKLIQLNSILLPQNVPYPVRLIESVTLPPRTNNLVHAKIDGYFSTTPIDFYIEDNHRPSADIFMVGRSLLTPTQEGRCFINIMNPTATSILLYACMNVANAIPMYPADFQICCIQPTSYVPPEADWECSMPLYPRTEEQPYDITTEIDFSQCA
ncbi:unnamed protein product, partial [Cylicostephanus goldi]